MSISMITILRVVFAAAERAGCLCVTDSEQTAASNLSIKPTTATTATASSSQSSRQSCGTVAAPPPASRPQLPYW